MSEYVPAELRRLIRERAGHRCEYCLLHEEDAFLPHEPDHIIAVKHRGETTEGNLAWTCFVCNRGKGSDLASVGSKNLIEAHGNMHSLLRKMSMVLSMKSRFHRGDNFMGSIVTSTLNRHTDLRKILPS